MKHVDVPTFLGHTISKDLEVLLDVPSAIRKLLLSPNVKTKDVSSLSGNMRLSQKHLDVKIQGFLVNAII